VSFRFEQAAGAVVILFVLVDVFLTVLYARAGTGILSARLARTVWRLFKPVSRVFGRNRGKALSFCAPTVLVSLVGTWALLLALGTGLMIHPALGTGVRYSHGRGPGDFASAVYAGSTSLSFISEGDFFPATPAYRLLYLFNSLIGVSVMTLTLTYLMQVYTALRERNTFGLKLHMMSGETADAVELLASIGAHGKFEATYSVLAEMAAEAAKVKEAHQFYPVLALFRFRDAYYSMSEPITLGLDMVSLIKAALDDEEYGWLKESTAVMLLWRTLILQTDLLDNAYDFDKKAARGQPPDAATLERWRRRYLAASERFRSAGIRTRADAEEGIAIYTTLRAQWEHRITWLAPAMEYQLSEVDPGGTHPTTTEGLPDFRNRLKAIS
jgi:hypothetical protein